jgi:phenylacetic acid degradation operon negative regulatory protein
MPNMPVAKREIRRYKRVAMSKHRAPQPRTAPPRRSPRGRAAAAGLPRLKPQSVIFTLLAEHLLGRDAAVSSGSFIEVLRRVGISEHATRATLLRMAARGLLERQRAGREIYFRMTPRCAAILEGGKQRIWKTGVVNTARGAGATLTLLTFSLPEAQRKKRSDLRARLTWAGFGPLQNGVWLAPGEVDVAPIVGELGLGEQVRVFHTRPSPPTRADALIGATFDLASLARRYRAFIAHWEGRGARDAHDALVLTLQLSTHWLRIIRDDPRVPVQLLPRGWPAIRAQKLFRALHGAHRSASRALARELLDMLPSRR